MKIIDLLNKIANREELPKKFVYNDKVWCLASDGTYFIGNDYGYDFWLAHGDDKFEDEPIKLNELNDKIEIIIGDKENKEEKKIPEKLILHTLSNNDSADFTTLQDFNNRDIQRTINWILDYLKNKGDE